MQSKKKEKNYCGITEISKTYSPSLSNLLSSWWNENNYRHVIHMRKNKDRNPRDPIWLVAVGKELCKKC